MVDISCVFFRKSHPVARVAVKQVTKQLSLDSRPTNADGLGFDIKDRLIGWAVPGRGISEGSGGGRVLGEGRGGGGEGREGLHGTGGGERGIFGGRGAVLGRERVGEGREQFRGGGGEDGGAGIGGVSGGRGGVFRGVFGGAGGGLGSEAGAGSNADLSMRSDALYSPPVSPVPWLRDYPSSVHPGKAPTGLGEPRPRRNGVVSKETGKETHSLITFYTRTHARQYTEQ